MGDNSMDLMESEAWNKSRKSLGWWRRPAAVCMGLLVLILLIVILILVARGPGVNDSHSTSLIPTSPNKCENLTHHWMQLQTSYITLSENTIQLQSNFYTLDREKDALRAERDVASVDRDSLRAELDVLKPDRDALESERDSLRNETDTLKNERDVLAVDREFLRLERDALKPERDTLKKERDALNGEKDALVAERDGLRDEEDVIKPEIDALKKELDLLKVEQSGLRVEKDTLMETKDNLTVIMEGLQKKYNTLLESTKLTIDATETTCPNGWIAFRSKCYYISKKTDTTGWIFAKRACEGLKGHLVVINSSEENDFISSFYHQTWIGLSDIGTEGKWMWANGVDFAGEGFWSSTEPDNANLKEDCVIVLRATKKWTVVKCRTMLSYVCEK